MTDNEIIKALECCGSEINFCADCPYYLQDKENDFCEEDMNKDALNLINRQKAENKRLKQTINNFKKSKERHRAEIIALTAIIEKGNFTSYSACRAIEDRNKKNAEHINELKAEIERLKQQPISQDMIKQIQTDILNVFVDKLLGKSYLDLNDGGIYFHRQVVDFDKIINLVKEMTEEKERDA